MLSMPTIAQAAAGPARCAAPVGRCWVGIQAFCGPLALVLANVSNCVFWISAARGVRSAAPTRQRRAEASVNAPRAGPAGSYSGEWDKLSVEEIDEWRDVGPKTPLLDTVNYPVHLKNFNNEQLKQLCKELRSDIVHTVSRTGGHLSSSLGVVELTVAMHYVFNTPEDKIIWDVGHQAYGHKILTGRRKGMATIRQTNGLSGELAL